MQSRLGEKKNNYLRRWSRAVELAMTVAVLGGDDGETQWQQRRFFSTVQRHQSAFPSPLVYPFCSFSLFSPSVSLNFPADIPLFFLCFSVSVVSLSTQSVSLSRFPPFFCRLLSFLCPLLFLFFSCTRTVFIGAGGAGTTLPCPIAAHGVGSRRSTLSQHRLRRPMGTSLAGHGLSVFSSWGAAGGVLFWL